MPPKTKDPPELTISTGQRIPWRTGTIELFAVIHPDCIVTEEMAKVWFGMTPENKYWTTIVGKSIPFRRFVFKKSSGGYIIIPQQVLPYIFKDETT